MSRVPVLRPGGEIDIAAVARLRSSWLALSDVARPDLVVVDLTDVTFLDVAGVGLLVALRNQQQQHGGRLHLRAVPAGVAKVLRLTGVAPLFPVEPAPRPRTPSEVVDLRVHEAPRSGAACPASEV
ncbi:MAG TPA: STAS domain-containing protein [Kineosporiaceae bacterium]|nr:STAS domain-containing protein [Kineosporiaceae bacterium]